MAPREPATKTRRNPLEAVAAGSTAGGAKLVAPYEAAPDTVSSQPLDGPVLANLQQRGIRSANPCSDEVFCRRVFLDVIGTMPEVAETREFVADRSRDKRAKLIDKLLDRPEYADYWAMKWCDILRVKSEFPVNLWPNAVQGYHRWVRDSLRANLSYDKFARALLTASGSNFRVAPANFFRALQGRDANAIAEAVALTLMGSRLATWPEPQRKDLANIFSRVAYKTTAEWKEEIVLLDPKATTPLDVVFPDGTKARVPAGVDPRLVFADWFITGENEWFARNLVNRVWSWLLGRGVIHEPDDIRPDNPPAVPDLLPVLQQVLVKSGWDVKQLFRAILNSRTYQQSSIPQSQSPDVESCFACYPVRRLDAEVLADALVWLTGSGDTFSSPIPEPFTYIPENQRVIQLADGSIGSPFLEMFGRPARDTGLEAERNLQPTDAQRLHMINSSDVWQRLLRSPRLKAVMALAGGDRKNVVRGVYLTILSREPTAAELTAVDAYAKTPGLRPQDALYDLAWALVNTKEFLYRH